MTKITCFALGTVFGAYISQNYNIPNVKEEIDKLFKYLKSLEK